jgi:hypothetical protein
LIDTIAAITFLSGFAMAGSGVWLLVDDAHHAMFRIPLPPAKAKGGLGLRLRRALPRLVFGGGLLTLAFLLIDGTLQ